MMPVVWVLVAAGFITGHGPAAEMISFHKTEKECIVAKVEYDKMPWPSVVAAGGAACVEVKPVPGKPV